MMSGLGSVAGVAAVDFHSAARARHLQGNIHGDGRPGVEHDSGAVGVREPSGLSSEVVRSDRQQAEPVQAGIACPGGLFVARPRVEDLNYGGGHSYSGMNL